MISLSSSSVALLLACLGFFAYDLSSYRAATEAKLSAVASVLARNTAAPLLFDDPIAAEENLAALRAEGSVLCAVLANADGEHFAEFMREPPENPCALADPVAELSGVFSRIGVAIPIKVEGRLIGRLVIVSESIDISARVFEYATVSAVVLLAAGFVAQVFGRMLRRHISEPISDLLETFKQVSHQKDYSIRLRRYARDEVGRLVDAFNEMLGQIQDRDRELQENQDRLEDAVAERTVDLVAAVEDLNSEITQREKAEERIRWLAYYDTVTHLPNRQLLRERLDLALADASDRELGVAVIYLDLDRFKEVNDTLGHSAGDELLRMVSERLIDCLRGTDCVARAAGPDVGVRDLVSRQGGDEFTILLTRLRDQNCADGVADRILQALRAPFALGGTRVSIGTSLGIAVFPRDGRDSETIMKHADTAMYHAKEAGGDSYQFFSDSMRVAALERVQLARDLRVAVEDEAIELHYQPKLFTGSELVSGEEALIRWEHPERGLVSPADFIPICEESGLIIQVGEWVLREACRQSMTWLRRGVGAIPVAVNVSGRQFADEDFLPMVRRALETSGLDAPLLELEVTETAMILDEEEAVRCLRELRGMGVRVALDDFGTGFSSLNLIHRLPLDTLKVDGSFVASVESNEESRTIVRSIIGLAHSLGLEVVAEGVETPGQIRFLEECGCDQLQGYWFMRPLAARRVEERLLGRYAIAPVERLSGGR